ncbi:hypothetical protein B0H12DRAFT_175559 [Mycena haematopus]|nr:hypothetical protein B0H12DRAFT_175559 [Mycena haematopus]
MPNQRIQQPKFFVGMFSLTLQSTNPSQIEIAGISLLDSFVITGIPKSEKTGDFRIHKVSDAHCDNGNHLRHFQKSDRSKASGSFALGLMATYISFEGLYLVVIFSKHS